MNTREFLGLDEALTLLRSIVDAAIGRPGIDRARDAVNRVVADTIVAPMNVPPFTASAMDGYAVCCSDPIFAAQRRMYCRYKAKVWPVHRSANPLRQITQCGYSPAQSFPRAATPS